MTEIWAEAEAMAAIFFTRDIAPHVTTPAAEHGLAEHESQTPFHKGNHAFQGDHSTCSTNQALEIFILGTSLITAGRLSCRLEVLLQRFGTLSKLRILEL